MNRPNSIIRPFYTLKSPKLGQCTFWFHGHPLLELVAFQFGRPFTIEFNCNKIHSLWNILGMIAVRENRYVVLAKDFEKAYKNQLKNKDEMEHEFYH